MLLTTLSCSQSESDFSSSFLQKINVPTEFYYSDEFAKRYNPKQGELIDEWKSFLAVAILRAKADGYDSCSLKIYLGNNLHFDYPTKDNFINIMGDRFEEVFFFADDVTDEDARLHAQIVFQSANSILIHGFNGGKISAIAGFNIDYVFHDVANGMSYIKTLGIPCNVLETKEYSYYLRLKPKGIDKSEDFFKFKLPLNE